MSRRKSTAARRVLLLHEGEGDPPVLPERLAGEIVGVKSAREAIAVLEKETFDLFVLAEVPCQSASPSETMNALRTARSRAVRVELLNGEEQALVEPPPEGEGDREDLPDPNVLTLLFEHRVRPAFKEKGGDIEFVRVEGRRVVVRFVGICVLCPSSREQHLGELERYLQKAVPGVRSLSVADDEDPGMCEE